MGKRLSKIVTRTGDDGTTGLTGGSRVLKSDARMHAIGTIDELNSFTGLFVVYLKDGSFLKLLYLQIQHELFDIGGELSMPEHAITKPEHWQKLETHIERLNGGLEPLENFILPGGSKLLSYCHIVRTVARRAERVVIELSQIDKVNKDTIIYLNRLSDLAFVTARYIAHEFGDEEILWQASSVIKLED